MRFRSRVYGGDASVFQITLTACRIFSVCALRLSETVASICCRVLGSCTISPERDKLDRRRSTKLTVPPISDARGSSAVVYTTVIVKLCLQHDCVSDSWHWYVYLACSDVTESIATIRSPELSTGPFLFDPIQPNPSADWPNPTQRSTSGKIWTQPDTTNNVAYSLVVTYFYTQNLSRTFSLPSCTINCNCLMQPNLV